MKIYSYSAGLLLAILIMSACNKTKINANRLIKAGEWTVTELSVDGTNEDELPKWSIEDCDIYDESCLGEWENEEGGHADFIWQFRDKGKTFEISRQENEEGHSHGHAGEEAAAQCYAFSGIYEVIERKKDMMQFQTMAALGHAGESVVIKIEKQ